MHKVFTVIDDGLGWPAYAYTTHATKLHYTHAYWDNEMTIIIWCVYCLSSLNFSKYFLSFLNFYILDKGYHQAKGFRKLIINWNCNAGHTYLDLFYFCPSFPVILWERFCWIRKCKLICKLMIKPRDLNPRNWTLVDQKTTRATNHPPIPTKKCLT